MTLIFMFLSFACLFLSYVTAFDGALLLSLFIWVMSVLIAFCCLEAFKAKGLWSLLFFVFALCVIINPHFQGAKMNRIHSETTERLLKYDFARKNICRDIDSYTGDSEKIFEEGSALFKALDIERMTGLEFGYCGDWISEAKKVQADQIIANISRGDVFPTPTTKSDGDKETFSELLSYFFEDQGDQVKTLIRSKYPRLVAGDNSLIISYSDPNGKKVTVNASSSNYAVSVVNTEYDELKEIGVSVYDNSYKFIAFEDDVPRFYLNNLLGTAFDKDK